MDVGSFLGTDMRRLVSDISPSAKTAKSADLNLYAVDIANHWPVGHYFFRDPDFPARFIEGDILYAYANEELKALQGRMDVISIIHVLHQWNYETQRSACVQLAKLTRG